MRQSSQFLLVHLHLISWGLGCAEVVAFESGLGTKKG